MKKLLSLILALTLILSLAACGAPAAQEAPAAPAAPEAPAAPAASEAPAADDHTYDVEYWSGLSSDDTVSWNSPTDYKKIGLIVPDTTSEFYNGIMQDVTRICEEAGYECVADGINSDVTRGITAIETWVASGVDAIIIMAQDQSCDLALKKAMEQGVLVVSASAKVQYYHHWLMQDNFDVGYQTAVMAAEWMKAKGFEDGQYITLSNIANEAVADKSRGVVDGMKELLPNAQSVGDVVVTTGMDQVRNDTDTLLMQYPDVKCIVAMHNAFSVVGLEAAKSAGKKYGEFAVFGSALSEQVLTELNKADSMYEGEIWMGDQGRSMAEHTIALLEGESFPRDWAALNFPISRDNLTTYYDDYYKQLNG